MSSLGDSIYIQAPVELIKKRKYLDDTRRF